MKLFYLVGSVIFTVLILLFGFSNIGSQCNSIFLFLTPIQSSFPPIFIFFGLSGLGILTGIFYFGFISSLLKENNSEEGDSDW